MSDDARPLIDNPYRASHTPIIAGDVNVTDLMARAWDRGFAAGDERLRSDFQSAVSPDERLREAAKAALPFLEAASGDIFAVGQQFDCTERSRTQTRAAADAVDTAAACLRIALAAADREKPSAGSDGEDR